MTSDRFTYLIQKAFSPFLSDLGFKPLSLKLSGLHHSANFIRKDYTLIVSFESISEFCTAMLVQNNDKNLSSIDDPKKNPRLSDLNRMYMGRVTPSDRKNNELFFSTIKIKNQNENPLLRCAKDLRLVLPGYLRDHSRTN